MNQLHVAPHPIKPPRVTEVEVWAHAIGHDLKAPLRSIEMFASALREDCGDLLPGEGRHCLQRITANAARFEPVDLSALAHQAAGQLQAREPQRGVGWRIASNLQAHGDSGALNIRLRSLLDNAWKFAHPIEPALVEFARGSSPFENCPHKTAYFVRDNGAGFDGRHGGRIASAGQLRNGAQTGGATVWFELPEAEESDGLSGSCEPGA